MGLVTDQRKRVVGLSLYHAPSEFWRGVIVTAAYSLKPPSAIMREMTARRTARFKTARFRTAFLTARLFTAFLRTAFLTARLFTAFLTTALLTARFFTARLAAALLTAFFAKFASLNHLGYGCDAGWGAATRCGACSTIRRIL